VHGLVDAVEDVLAGQHIEQFEPLERVLRAD
jgi:hypothetical protein